MAGPAMGAHEQEALTATSINDAEINGITRRANMRYDLEVVPDQNYKSSEFKLGSFRRPHMRAFHYAWFGFFAAKVAWYATSDVLPFVTATFAPSNSELWATTVVGLVSLALTRLAVGPLCDVYGPRVPFVAMLCLGSLPVALVGAVNSLTGLYLQRFFVGIIAGTLVSGEFWASRMFAKEVVGTANALVAGWSDLGAGMTGLIMGSILIPMFQAMTIDDNVAFRAVCLVPAALAFVTGALMYRYADDTPRGNYQELKKDDPTLASKRPLECFVLALKNKNAWILSIQYACCFGLELILNSVAVLYFEKEFGMAPEAAATAIGNIFGWLEFFARPLGGIASDLANARSGMRGRLSVQAGTLLFEGIFTLVFASCYTLGGSVAVLVFFSLFVKAAKGSTFAVVPYVHPPHMGSVMGLTSSGGVVGAIAFDAVFRSFEYSYRQALIWTGIIVILCSLLTALISIDGHRGLITGADRHVDPETGIVRCRSGGAKASGSSSNDAGSDRRPDGASPQPVTSA